MDYKKYGLHITQAGLSWTRQGQRLRWAWPEFPLRGGYQSVRALESVAERPWLDGAEIEAVFSLGDSPARLITTLRVREAGSFCRMRYRLEGADAFEGRDGRMPIRYGGFSADWLRLTEIQLSQFDRILHSFLPQVETYSRAEAIDRGFIGPIVALHCEEGVLLAAYEHGAESPDHFLRFDAAQERIALRSNRGNYYDGQPVDEYLAPWIQLGMAGDLDGLYRAYRTFMLHEMTESGASREPAIFYNTWHFQEGRKYNEGASVLKDMNEEYLLRDIDRAHRLGVEVYVIDTGWYQKTGDWEVNRKFFPSDMKAVRARLEGYGMRLGLWFNPIVAAETSALHRNHADWVIESDGKQNFWGKIWETEESWGMCLDSGYGDLFIEKLLEMRREYGVRYFKWDAIDQYGCNAPAHFHGTQRNDPAERADCYSYRMALQMIRIAEAVTTAYPDVTVDFDITEGRRNVGLGFLSAGKYFLINNGPYFHNFDIPRSVKMEPDTINVFFYPGAARPQICRQSACFDFLIPSTLFLTHFLPHGDRIGRLNSMAALALGGNGIWGYLDEMDEEGIAHWADFTEKYKRVRDAVTRAYPITRGLQGGSPEIHEKIDPETGTGIVVFFTRAAVNASYRTQPLARYPDEVVGADGYSACGTRLDIDVRLNGDEAKVVFLMSSH